MFDIVSINQRKIYLFLAVKINSLKHIFQKMVLPSVLGQKSNFWTDIAKNGHSETGLPRCVKNIVVTIGV